MVSITSLVALLAASLASNVVAIPTALEARQDPNPEIFVVDLYTDCTRSGQPADNRALFLQDAQTSTQRGTCFDTKAREFGALFIEFERQPAGLNCNIFAFNSLGCTGTRQGPFHTKDGGPASCAKGYPITPSSVSYKVICT